MNEIAKVRAVELPWRLEMMPGGEMTRLVGRNSRDLIVAFSSWSQNQDELGGEAAFSFINTVIGSRSDGLLIRDRQNLWYQSGVPGAEGGVLKVAEKIQSIGASYDRIVTLGSSMGGYAALLFAHLVNADRAVAVVPQLRIGTTAAASIGDIRFADDYARLEAKAADPSFLYLDQLGLSGRTKYYAIFGDQDIYDVEHVRLAQSTPIDVKIMAGHDHNGTAIAVLKQRMLELVL